MTVQYILKNESNKPLELKLAVESNFADVSFADNTINYFNIEAADKEQVHILQNKTTNIKKDIQAIRLTDVTKGVCFGFEPNENCGYYYSPLVFKRPDFSTGDLMTSSATFVSTMYWDVNIESGKETEKMINFTITSVKKERK
jgi:hypothetical protein